MIPAKYSKNWSAIQFNLIEPSSLLSQSIKSLNYSSFYYQFSNKDDLQTIFLSNCGFCFQYTNFILNNKIYVKSLYSI